MLTLSDYVVVSEPADGQVVYLSTRHQRRVVVDVEEHRQLHALDATDPATLLDPATTTRLVDAGVLVARERDEAAELLADHRQARTGGDELVLTIAPTIACNLACRYCFEPDHQARSMTSEDEQQLLRFVRRSLTGRRVLRVVWFGGEPLLAPATIVRLSSQLLRMASFAGVAMVGEIITNGTRLTPQVARDLRAARVMGAQITLDGPARVHDRLRPTRAGRGSYADTVAGALAAHQYLAVALRVNLDRHNLDTVPDLLEDLVARGLGGAAIGFARVEPPAVYGTGSTDVDPAFLTVEEFAAAEVALQDAARRAGLRPEGPGASSEGLSGDVALPCVALDRAHYVIEPGGKVARCWAEVADPSQQTGRLLEDGQLLPTVRDERWQGHDAIDDECASCAVLPLCWGGCPKARIDGAMGPQVADADRQAFKRRYVCSPRRFNLPALLAAEPVG